MATRKKRKLRQERRHAARKSKAARAKLFDASSSDIVLYGEISDWDVSAKGVNDALVAVGDTSEVTVRINSGGGDVFEGIAIYNMLAAHQANIRIVIEGAALSIASLIAMAGDTIAMASNALFMLHDPRMFDGGTAEDKRRKADLLDKAAKQLRDTYVARTGLSESEVTDLMEAETWFTAEEALEQGFITEIIEAKQGVAAAFDPSSLSIPGRLLKLVAQHCDVSDLEDDSFVEVEGMDPKLRKLYEKFGMDSKLTDEEAVKWATENSDKMIATLDKNEDAAKKAAAAKAKADAAAKAKAEAAATISADAGEVATIVDKLITDREAKAAAERKVFAGEVEANIKLVFEDNVPDGLLAKCMLETDISAVRKHITDAKANTRNDIGLARFSSSQPRDEHIKDVSTALHMKALSASGCKDATVEKILPADGRGKGWVNFQNMSLLGLCRECLLIDGYSHDQVSRLSNPDLAKAAFGFPNATALRGVRIYASSPAVHVTGTLANITMDAINKSLLAGYDEAPQTWRGPMRQAASVPDFKNINRIRLGAAPNLPVWPDNTKPDEVKVVDQVVSYAVEARAEKVSFSWRLFVNDDMDAISRIPRLLGDAASRTVNAVAWAQVTGNPTMAYDSVALFSAASGSRKRANLITGSATPTTATVGAMKNLMRQMRGLNTPEDNESDDVLNLEPKYIACPSALEQTVLQLVRSGADPADNKSNAVFNTAGTLTPIVEPLLDGTSTTAWYLFADPNRIDTVEVSFLQGQETPASYDWVDEETLSRNFMIVQTFEAKAIDHRGSVRHDGA